MTHTKSNLIQGNEYCPFGPDSYREQTASSWTRDNSTGNNFLYNGGTELNQTTQVYDLYYRNYDPVLGRFGQVDPMASKYGPVSPYHFAGNNPARFNDPMGDDYGDNAYMKSFNRFLNENVSLNSPHDTRDPNRMYRGSDPYGTHRGRRLYAEELERAALYREEYSESTGPSLVERARNGDPLALMQFGLIFGEKSFEYILMRFTMDGSNYGGILHREDGQNVSLAYNTIFEDWKTGAWVASGSTNTFLFGALEQQTNGGVPDPPLGLNWLNTAAANVSIWGGATSIAVNSPRPRYTGPKEWAGQVKAGTKFGNRLGYLGLGLTAADMVTNGVNTSNTLDATFGVVSFAGVPGAIIGGVYFLGNLVTEGITGKTIGQHVDNNFYIMPGIVGGPPIMLIPKN